MAAVQQLLVLSLLVIVLHACESHAANVSPAQQLFALELDASGGSFAACPSPSPARGAATTASLGPVHALHVLHRHTAELSQQHVDMSDTTSIATSAAASGTLAKACALKSIQSSDALRKSGASSSG